MEKVKATSIVKARKKLLIQRNNLLLDRIKINNNLRQINKELNGIDLIIVNEVE